MRKRHFLTLPAVLSCLLAIAAGLSPDADAAFATFDSFTEGVLPSTFSDGGITFSAPQSSSGGGSVFTVEQANATLSGPFFTPNNALTLGGFSSGPGNSFPAIGSFSMTTGGLADSISVEMFYLDNPNAGGNQAELNLLLGGTPVGSTALILPGAGGGAVQHHTLAISGVLFDQAVIDSSGAFQSGAYFAVFDNIRIREIPEPSTLAAALLATPFVTCLRTRRRGE